MNSLISLKKQYSRYNINQDYIYIYIYIQTQLNQTKPLQLIIGNVIYIKPGVYATLLYEDLNLHTPRNDFIYIY